MSNINQLVLEIFDPRKDGYIQRLAKDFQTKQAQRQNFMNQPSIRNKYSPEVIQKVLNKFKTNDNKAFSNATSVIRDIHDKVHGK